MTVLTLLADIRSISRHGEPRRQLKIPPHLPGVIEETLSLHLASTGPVPGIACATVSFISLRSHTLVGCIS